LEKEESIAPGFVISTFWMFFSGVILSFSYYYLGLSHSEKVRSTEPSTDSFCCSHCVFSNNTLHNVNPALESVLIRKSQFLVTIKLILLHTRVLPNAINFFGSKTH
jgi:hypothetical protein